MKRDILFFFVWIPGKKNKYSSCIITLGGPGMEGKKYLWRRHERD